LGGQARPELRAVTDTCIATGLRFADVGCQLHHPVRDGRPPDPLESRGPSDRRRAKRHEHTGADDVRVPVDRLWPRDLSRERARIDLWLKEIAPSDTLRRLFHGDPAGWEEFKAAYYAEFDQPAAQGAVQSLLDRLTREPVTLLFAARDETRNNAVALKEWLERRFIDLGS
jgi:uncharacterized protein YeaO (DUF488 family)